ncbi:MAG: hypothetical protein COA57_16400 [Flavobacteriales bacterium]|nr:MAG: hypothetical protein COA57_16400 [Flavobacteriales bacterium]
MTLASKQQIRELIGHIRWFDDQYLLAAKLNYVSGIGYFDEILCGRTLKDINAVIHIEKYPKGLLIKIAKSFKSYLLPYSTNEIKSIMLNKNLQQTQLSIALYSDNPIIFEVEDKNIRYVEDFLEEINIEYEKY